MKWYWDDGIREREVAVKESGGEKLTKGPGYPRNETVFESMDGARQERVVIVRGDQEAVEGTRIGIATGKTNFTAGCDVSPAGRAILLEAYRHSRETGRTQPEFGTATTKTRKRKQDVEALFPYETSERSK